MSKITYNVTNLTASDAHVGTLGFLPGYASKPFTMEEGSPDDDAIAAGVAKRVFQVTSALEVATVTSVRKRTVNGTTLVALVGWPTVMVSSGTSNATGQLTLTTALSYRPLGPTRVRVPAGVVVGDATGGLYAATFSSTTVCQLTGSPVTANAAFTQTTGSAVTLASVAIPGGLMGLNSQLQIRSRWTTLNNANVKTAGIQLGAGAALFGSLASNLTSSLVAEISNRGSLAVQGLTPSSLATPFGLSTTAAVAEGTTNTAVDTTLVFTINNAVATDFVILENFVVELLDAA